MNKTLYDKFRHTILRLFPKWQANRLYKKKFGRDINWSDPMEFNEMLRWLQFNDDTSQWTFLSDKYRVRHFLEQHGHGDMLVKLYGVWDNADNIDFSSLSSRFVLKTNHGSGGVYIVEDKNNADMDGIRARLKNDLKNTFGIESAEPHYWPIKPVVIAEEMLDQDGGFSTSLIDYKFYCVQGEPLFCAVMYNRNLVTHEYDVRLYDMDWHDISHLLAKNKHMGDCEVPRPVNFEAMKNFCREMCAPFAFVRMDFYECGGRLYFGEFTFTPAACTGGSLSAQASEMLAHRMKKILPRHHK